MEGENEELSANLGNLGKFGEKLRDFGSLEDLGQRGDFGGEICCNLAGGVWGYWEKWRNWGGIWEKLGEIWGEIGEFQEFGAI